MTPPATIASRGTVAVIGGGLAGLAAGSALADAGYHVELFERRPYLGGRASSYELPGTGEVVDNCQHVLLGCCTNLIDFYRRLGVEQQIRWYDEITFILPGGKSSTLKPGALPAPFHAAPSFLESSVLDLKDKLAIARAMMALIPALPSDNGENFQAWLERHGQTKQAIDRFWAPVLISALNEELDRISVRYAALVFRDSFLKSAEAGRMGVPAVPLSQLYGTAAALHRSARRQGASARRRSIRFAADGDGVRLVRRRRRDSQPITRYWRRRSTRVEKLLPDAAEMETLRRAGAQLRDARRSPAFICGSIARSRRWNTLCCWSAPSSGCSTSRRSWPRARIRRRREAISNWWSARRRRWSTSRGRRSSILRCANWRSSFPAVREAKLTKATVVKEIHATFSPAPGSDAFRPSHTTPWPRLFLAGDWTATGWPATMEGAVRSGYGAAEALRAGQKFLVPDLPAKGLMRFFERSQSVGPLRITPAKRGSGLKDVSIEHDRYFAEP